MDFHLYVAVAAKTGLRGRGIDGIIFTWRSRDCLRQGLNGVNLETKIIASGIQHCLKISPPPLGQEPGRAEQNLSISVKYLHPCNC